MTEKFIKKAKFIYGDKYDYSCISFVDYDTPIQVRCTEHGTFKITPKLHLGRRTGKCPKCIFAKICRDRSLLNLEPLDEETFTNHWFQISQMV